MKLLIILTFFILIGLCQSYPVPKPIWASSMYTLTFDLHHTNGVNHGTIVLASRYQSLPLYLLLDACEVIVNNERDNPKYEIVYDLFSNVSLQLIDIEFDSLFELEKWMSLPQRSVQHFLDQTDSEYLYIVLKKYIYE